MKSYFGWREEGNSSTYGVDNDKFVTLNTSQTITSVKTFDNKNSIPIAIKHPNDEFAGVSDGVYIRFLDSNDYSTGWVENRFGNLSTGSSFTNIWAMTYTDSTKTTNVSGNIAVYAFPDGTTYATAPTPATTDNSTKIATTAWVRNNYTPCTTTATTSSTASSVKPAVIIENYYNSSTGDWYRVWSDNFIEQGGKVSATTSASTSLAGGTVYYGYYTKTFLKTFTTKPTLSLTTSDDGGGVYFCCCPNLTTTKVKTELFGSENNVTCTLYWIAKGY